MEGAAPENRASHPPAPTGNNANNSADFAMAIAYRVLVEDAGRSIVKDSAKRWNIHNRN